jgi:energy-coupling factor transporter ATP-binding protein EcfA2
MRNLLDNIFGYRFDTPEFWTGIILGVVFVLVFRRLRPISDWILRWVRGLGQILSETLSRTSTDHYHRELIMRAQSMHVAKDVFMLDEIVIPPRILAPPLPTDPLRSEPVPEHTLGVVPNLPDWTFLSGIYQAPTISLGDSLKNGANLLITGEPGSGKTTALAYLAIIAANQEPEAGVAAELLPVFVHAADFPEANRIEKDTLRALITAAQQQASSGLASRLSGYLSPIIRSGRALILLDGLDELPPEEAAPIAAWLVSFLDSYPGNRVVAAGPPQNVSGIVQAGLVPVTISPWSEYDVNIFLTQWGQSWQHNIIPNLPKKRIGDLDPALITGWLSGISRGSTPLEITLILWASYTGDVRGAKVTDSMRAYMARVLSPDEHQPAEATALSWITERQGAVPESALRRGTPVGDFVDAGILIRRTRKRVSFAQPAVGAYLAARALTEAGIPEIVLQPGWVPAETTLGFFAGMGDLTHIVEEHLKTTGDPLESKLFMVARWLRETPGRLAWKGQVLRSLATVASAKMNPYGLRLRAIHALARLDEPSIAILFHRMLGSDDPNSRVLAALGLGGLRHEESIEKLLDGAYQDRNLPVRQAACLALASIGTESSLEGLGQILLEGDEAVRLASAEALASHPSEGHGMLRDAIELNNLLTRRAAVFGLARIREPWAMQILQQIQVEDDQWVVRGAAAEAIERRVNPPWKIYPPVLEIAELPWLIDFASREGHGVAPGRAALELLRLAFSKGTHEEKLAALEAITIAATDELGLEMRQAIQSQETYLRDAAFEALWRLKSSGVEVESFLEPGRT